MRSNRMKDWVRFASKVGVVLTEPKVRAAIADDLKARYDDVSDSVSSKYDDAVDRLDAVGAALQGRSYSSSRTMGFLLGLGVGAGLALLLAPAAGTETRATLRNKAEGLAEEIKDRFASSASNVSSRVHQSVSHMPSTGTEG
jgi:hypothetical protein